MLGRRTGRGLCLPTSHQIVVCPYYFNLTIWKENKLMPLERYLLGLILYSTLSQGFPTPGRRLGWVCTCSEQGCTAGGELECNALEPSRNHPETTPSLWPVEKVSSARPAPGAKKVGDRCFTWLTWFWRDVRRPSRCSSCPLRQVRTSERNGCWLKRDILQRK